MWNLTDKRSVAIRLMSPHDILSSHQATLLYVKSVCKDNPFHLQVSKYLTLIPFTNRTWKCVWGVRCEPPSQVLHGSHHPSCMQLPRAGKKPKISTPPLPLRLMHASL